MPAAICTYCGTPAREGDVFCNNCGEPLDYKRMREEETAAQAADPAIDQKPARVRTDYLYMLLASLVGLGFALVGALVGALLGWNIEYIVISCVLGFIFLLMLGVAVLSYRNDRKAMRRMRSGEVQVIHWTYSGWEWQQFTTEAWERGIKGYLRVAGLVLVGLLVGLGCAGRNSGSVGGVILFFAVILLFPLIFAIPLWLRRRQHSGDAYLSSAGIILGGWCITSSLSNLDGVDYETGHPAVLRFITYYRGSHGEQRKNTIKVPVPHGREEEARQLVHDFKFRENWWEPSSNLYKNPGC